MPHVRAVFAYVMAVCLSLPAAFAQSKAEGAPVAGGKAPVSVKSVHFDPAKFGGQKHPWIRMQVELQANFNPDSKEPKEGAKKAANKGWVDKVKVTVTQIYKSGTGKDASEFTYYRAAATVLTMEVGGSTRSVYFYLPGDVVARDRLKATPDYYYVQVEVGGTEVPLFDERGKITLGMDAAIHKQIQDKKLFDGAKDLADRGVAANTGILRPQFLVPYSIFDQLPASSPSPEFIREDAGAR
jgi:hypothetical protein